MPPSPNISPINCSNEVGFWLTAQTGDFVELNCNLEDEVELDEIVWGVELAVVVLKGVVGNRLLVLFRKESKLGCPVGRVG